MSLVNNVHLTGFSGCVQYFNVTGYVLPISGPSVMVEVWPSSTLVQPKCSSPGVCLSSLCSEEDTFTKTCLSHCQSQLTCRPTTQNSSCICLHNVSDHFCDICISAARDQCSGEQQTSKHLWLIAVALPLIFILVIIGRCVCLCRVRHQDTKCEKKTFLRKTEQGTTNRAFCFDDNTNEVSSEMGKFHDQTSSDQQSPSMELYSDGSLSGAGPMPPSELEYFEIGSISREFHLENSSLRLDQHKRLYSTSGVRSHPKHWTDLRMLLTRFKKESPGNKTGSKKSENITSPNNQLWPQLETEQPQQTLTCYTNRFPQPEILEPIQCLSYEEICKLNASVEPAVSHTASLQSGPALSTTLMNATTEDEIDVTFTCPEAKCGQFSIITGKKCMRDQSSLSDNASRQKAIMPVNSLFKQSCLSAAGQDKAMTTSSAMVERWGYILNMQLPLSSYLPVFKDIACLPNESSDSCDMQSDIEEII